VASHDWFNGLSSFVGVIKWNGANIVVEDVSFNDAVEEGAANKSKFTINRCSCSTNVIPTSCGIVRESWIGVLEIGDGDCLRLVV
jgi:hypothetical protein